MQCQCLVHNMLKVCLTVLSCVVAADDGRSDSAGRRYGEGVRGAVAHIRPYKQVQVAVNKYINEQQVQANIVNP